MAEFKVGEKTGLRIVEGMLTREEFRKNAIPVDDIVVEIENLRKKVTLVLSGTGREITLPGLYSNVIIMIAQSGIMELSITTQLVGFLEVGRFYIDEPILYQIVKDDIEIYIAKMQL